MKALSMDFFLAETLEEKAAVLANLLEKVAEEAGVSVHYLDIEEVMDAHGFKHLTVYFNELQVFEAVY